MDCSRGGGVYSAYYAPSSDVAPAASPGLTQVYDGREAGIIKAGLVLSGDGHYWDEGLFAFKPTFTIDQFAAGTVTYDVENQEGSNPVWMTIEIDTGVVGNRSDNTNYQFIPASNPAGWHTVDAAAGQWQLMDSNGNGVGPLMSLSEVAAANSGLDVVRVYLRLGMGDSYRGTGSGTVAWVDKVTIGSTTYDFVTPKYWYVNPTGSDLNEGTEASPFLTIQKAIDSAASGETINVAAGTYAETLTIDKSLTLLGAQSGVDARYSRGSESIISSSDGAGSVQIQAGAGSTVTINGFTIGGSPAKAIHVNGETGQVNVLNNIIESSSVDGINLYSADNADVENNWVKGAMTSGITAGNSDANPQIITTATIKNNLVEGSTYGITGYQTGSTISNNEVIGPSWQGSGIGGQFYSTTISNNIVYGYSAGAGIAFNGYTNRADSHDVTVSGNNVYENAYNIYINQSLEGNNIIVSDKNKITGNSYNVLFDGGASGILDAANNYWGTTNESLIKSSISSPGNVNYSPWYADESMTTLMDGNPVISGTPSDITEEATSSSGAFVNYTLPTATDPSDGTVSVDCSPSSGSEFSFGGTPVNCSATDSDGNTATSTFNVDVVDTTKPTAGIDVNSNNPYTNSRDVVLTLSYSDSGSGVKECQYKNAGESFTEWMPCEATINWVLSEGVDGNRRVYYNVKDSAGNIKESYDDITLDTTLPTFDLNNIVVNDNENLNVDLSLNISDADSGINSLQVYEGNNPSENFEINSDKELVNLGEGNPIAGTYHLTILAVDNAGNSANKTITLTVLSSNQKLANNETVEVGDNETEIVFNDQSSNVSNIKIPSSVDSETEIKLDLTALKTTDNSTNQTNVTLSGDISLSRDSDYSYSAEIPAGTVISGDGWDGKLTLPTVKTNSLNSVSGGNVNVIIDIGGGVSLTLSNAVKVTLGGQAGKSAAWATADGVLTPITLQCNSVTDSSNIVGNGECYFNDGADLIIWTKHFTRFAAYTPVAAAAAVSSGGGGSGCLTQWTCTGWSACGADGVQTRTCGYASGFCAPASVKPAETQSCVLTNTPTANSEGNTETTTGGAPITGFFVFGENGSLNSRGIGFLVIIVAMIAGFMYRNSLSKKKKKSEKKK